MALPESRGLPHYRSEAEPRKHRVPLRLVRGPELTPRARRRRASVAFIWAALLATGSLVGVVAAHVTLTQNQFRLDRLRSQVQAAQARNADLQYQVAQLQSPGRIVQSAEQRLHMVLPATVTYLAPVTAGQSPTAPSQQPPSTGTNPAPATPPAPAAAAPSRAATATTAGGVRR